MLLDRVILIFFLFCVFITQAQNLPGSGNAYEVNNVNAYVTIPNFGQLGPPLTISAWVRYVPTNSAQVIFASDNTGTLGYHGFWFGFTGGNHLRINTGNSGCYSPMCRRSILTPFPPHLFNEWVHVAAVLHGINNADLYINGVSMATTTDGSGLMTMSQTANPIAQIGSHHAQGMQRVFFNGGIDEVVVWGRTLTEAEVRSNMCRKIDTTTAVDLFAYYKFDENGVNTPLVDYSGNNRNGTHMSGGSKVLSGASIGDESAFVYPPNMAGGVQMTNSFGDYFDVQEGVSGSAMIQVYTVNEPPNHMNISGGDSMCVPPRYFGTYAQSTGTAVNTIDVLAETSPPAGMHFDREANTGPVWQSAPSIETSEGLQFENNGFGVEFILDLVREFDPDLPDSLRFCDYPDTIFANAINPLSGWSVWDNNSQDSFRVVNSEGEYTMSGYYYCGDDDSIPFFDTVIVVGDPQIIDTLIQKCEDDTVVLLGEIFPDEGLYQFTAINPDGCDFEVIVEIVDVLVIEKDTLFPVCEGEVVYFLGETFDDEGMYTILLQDTVSCPEEWTIEVDYSVEPVQITLSESICGGEFIDFFEMEIWEPGEYTYTVENPEGCDTVITMYVTRATDDDFFIEAPEAPICDGIDTIIYVVGLRPNASVLWNTGEHSHQINVSRAGWYWVEHGENCPVERDSVFIDAENCDPRLFIPNAFSPNDNGRNDQFQVKGRNIKDFEMRIFTRWGQQIFYSDDINVSWDGTYNNELAPSAIYVYIIIATGYQSKDVIDESGTLFLVR